MCAQNIFVLYSISPIQYFIIFTFMGCNNSNNKQCSTNLFACLYIWLALIFIEIFHYYYMHFIQVFIAVECIQIQLILTLKIVFYLFPMERNVPFDFQYIFEKVENSSLICRQHKQELLIHNKSIIENAIIHKTSICQVFQKHHYHHHNNNYE